MRHTPNIEANNEKQLSTISCFVKQKSRIVIRPKRAGKHVGKRTLEKGRWEKDEFNATRDERSAEGLRLRTCARRIQEKREGRVRPRPTTTHQRDAYGNYESMSRHVFPRTRWLARFDNGSNRRSQPRAYLALQYRSFQNPRM